MGPDLVGYHIPVRLALNIGKDVEYFSLQCYLPPRSKDDIFSVDYENDDCKF